MSTATKAAFVIHEFGVPYKEMELIANECRSRGIPLIEDCAHTIDSISKGRLVGSWGDWIVCSLPKIFPVKAGGVLLGRTLNYEPTASDSREINTISSIVSAYLDQLSASSTRRREVYRELTGHAARFGLQPVFTVTDEITPWFFPLPVPDPQRFAEAAEQAGIEYGYWHGTNIIVFPCHQYLDESHVARIGTMLENAFLKNVTKRL